MEHKKSMTPLEAIEAELEVSEKTYDTLTHTPTRTMTAEQKREHQIACQKALAEKRRLQAERNKKLRIEKLNGFPLCWNNKAMNSKPTIKDYHVFSLPERRKSE
jgi:hypothetical protein